MIEAMVDEPTVGVADSKLVQSPMLTGDGNVFWQVINPDRRQAALRRGPFGLPMVPEGRLIGRDDDLRQLHEALAPASGAVALTPADVTSSATAGSLRGCCCC